MGQDWERSQREKLVEKQKQRISKLQKEVEEELPLPEALEIEPKKKLL